MSHESPGDGIRCDHCNRRGTLDAPLLPNRGERLCAPCLDASVDADLNANGLRVVEDGRKTVYRPGYITPRAAR